MQNFGISVQSQTVDLSLSNAGERPGVRYSMACDEIVTDQDHRLYCSQRTVIEIARNAQALVAAAQVELGC